MTRTKIVEVKQVRKVLSRSGWEIVRRSNHQVWRCQCGQRHTLIVPGSESDHRSVKNLTSQLRKSGCDSLPDGI